MRKIHVLLISFVLVANLSAVAQKNLRSGYIVTLSGDTIHGFIDIRDWSVNPSKVHFKSSAEDEGMFYGPYDIKLFCIGSDIYEGGFVDVELTSRDALRYSTDPNLILEKQLVFLQLLVQGAKPLYVNENAVYKQFYIKSDSSFVLLQYKMYLKRTESSGKYVDVMIENKRYQGQLIIYFSDCQSMTASIKKASYDEGSLKKLFKEYYECKNEKFAVLEPKRNASLKLGLCLGLSHSGVDFEVLNFEKSKRTNFLVDPFGVSIELSRGLSHPEWSLFNELNYNTGFKLSKSELSNNPPYTELTTTTTYRFHSFKLLNLVRYKVRPCRKLSYFLNFGIVSEFYNGDWTRTTIGKAMYLPVNNTAEKGKKFRTSRFAAGMGLKYRHLSIEGRFETGNPKKMVGPVSSLILHYTF